MSSWWSLAKIEVRGRAGQSSFSSVKKHSTPQWVGFSCFKYMYLRKAPAAVGSHGSGTGVEFRPLVWGAPKPPYNQRPSGVRSHTMTASVALTPWVPVKADPLALAPKPVKVYGMFEWWFAFSSIVCFLILESLRLSILCLSSAALELHGARHSLVDEGHKKY
eukprot:scaffold677_cov77-Skeletonema_dohrnii-CCMP3373.AAC.4